MQYTDLHVELTPASEQGTFQVILSSRFHKKTRGRFRPPFDIGAFEQNLPKLRNRSLPRESPFHPNNLGPVLFRALFHDELLACFEETFARAEGNIRIKLHTLAGIPELHLINRLPWELLRRPGDSNPLIIKPQTAIVRYFPGAKGGPGVRPFPPRLKVLVLAPNPRDEGDHTDIESALLGLYKVFGKRNVTHLEKPTLGNLMRKLATETFHIIHIITHGAFWEEKQAGYLQLENDQGFSDAVTGRELASTISTAPEAPRLVMLFTCEGGKMRLQGGDHSFAGVASALIEHQLPAVVAMQFKIDRLAAEAFMEDFYWALTQGYPVDAAAGLARNQLFNKKLPVQDWCTPVVFMSTHDGRLFSQTQKLHINAILEGKLPKNNEEFENLAVDYRGEGLKNVHLGHRRQWNKHVLPKLKKLTAYVRSDLAVTFCGKARLPIWLALGHVFADTAGNVLGMEQLNFRALGSDRIESWSSDALPEPKPFEHDCQPGRPDQQDLVVSLSISNHIEADVGNYLQKHPSVQWREWLKIRVLPKPSRDSLKTAGEAVGLAKEIAQLVRERSQQHPFRTIHLFLSCPVAFALFMGMQLNACRRIRVYEWDRIKYFRTFLLQ